MKSLMLLVLALLFSSGLFCQDFAKLKELEVDAKNIQLSKKFATDYLTTQKSGSFYQFKDEAIDALKTQLTEDVQKAVYKQLKDQFGEYKSLEYAETWIQKGSTAIKIFRFKGEFEKSNKKLEIRVVLNETDKIAGFWIKPWSDMLN